MSTPDVATVLDRQLLLQLGDRLRALREARRINTTDMAARVGVTRTTLRAVENGDPATTIGTYLRVMSILGISADLALLAGDTLHPAPAHTAAARSRRPAPMVRVDISAADAKHQLQDLQSMALHEEAVRLVKQEPSLKAQALETLRGWLAKGDQRTAALWLEWLDILETGSWRTVLRPTRHAQQLRQSSPLVTIIPPDRRQQILDDVNALRRGISIGVPS